MALAPGTNLHQYEIVSALGAGGMGEVYRARDTRLERDVAIKVLPSHLASDREFLGRFEREAKAVAALSHPNILAIHDFGSSDGIVYAVMELLEGETLRQTVAQGPLPARRAIETAVQIAQGLAAAHDKGVVHRDLKPENVFVTRDGQVKILDFGLAKPFTTAQHSDTMTPTLASPTEPGRIVGTAAYMSPEQARGLPVDHRSDIFSLGTILHEMITGRRAFQRDSVPETLTAILREDPADVSVTGRAVPAGLRPILEHCLEKLPERRFRSASDVAFALRSIGHDTDALSGRAATLEAGGPAGRRASRRPGAAMAAVWAATVGLAVIGGWAAATRRTADGPPRLEPVFIQLTQSPGEETMPSLSPDGQSILFVGRATGSADIYLQRVGGRNPINLTPDTPSDELAPRFSPDGGRIAFSSDRDGGGIFVMGSTGESPRRLTTEGWDPSWSPDGAEIAYATSPTNDPLNRARLGEIWAVKVADGARRRVREADAVQPSWSPGGQRIAYWGLVGKGGQRDLFTVAADGSEETTPARPLTSDAAVDWNPAWSPDGRFVYFSSSRGGTMNLWRLRVDEKTGEPMESPESIVTPSSWSDGITFSRDGSLMAYSTKERRTTVLLTRLDPVRGAALGSLKPVVAGSAPVRDQAVSPDGGRIAYTSIGPQEDLHVIGVDGRGHLQLTDDLYRDRGPAWSPDGRTLAFYSDRGDGYEIWLIGADGTGLRALTTGSENGLWYPTWSPDGRRIAAQDGTRLYIIDATATSPAPPLRVFEAPLYWATSWSPDGDTLAGYTIPDAAGGPPRIRFMSASAGTARTLDVEGASPQWLPDGRRLLAGAREGLVLLDTVTGRVERLIEMQIPIPGYAVRLTPDGRHVSILTVQTEADVWLMKTEPAGDPDRDVATAGQNPEP